MPDPEGAYELLQRGTALLAGRHAAQAAVVLARAAAVEPGKGRSSSRWGGRCS